MTVDATMDVTRRESVPAGALDALPVIARGKSDARYSENVVVHESSGTGVTMSPV